MGLVTYTTPGVEVSQTEYDGNHTLLYNEFNGSIDNANIKSAAGIVDTKLATISTAGKVSESALPATYANATTFSNGIIVSDSGGTGISLSDGITIVTGGATITAGGLDINGGGATITGGLTVDDVGLTVTAGGLTVTAGGVTITDGNLKVQNSMIHLTNPSNDIIYNFGGADVNVGIATIQVTGTPQISWGETANRFQFSKGIDITTGSLTVANNITITNNDLTLTAGNLVLTAGGATVDGIDVSAHDVAKSGVHGAVPIISVQKSSNQTIDTAPEVITWETVNIDSEGDFASNVFTPQVAGTYFLIARLQLIDTTTGTGSFVTAIRKNGAVVEDTERLVALGSKTSVMLTAIVTANGSTDNFDVASPTHSTNVVDVISGNKSSFQAFRLALA